MNLLVANWKMAPDTPKAAVVLAKKTAALARTHKKTLTLAVCAPFVHIPLIAKSLGLASLGAQSTAPTDTIASTGLVSAGMLKSAGVKYCIVGHSEARARGDSNALVKEQFDQLFAKKIIPILCVGEKERDPQGWYLSSIKDQLESALLGVPKAALKRIVIAYEPIWAIGSNAVREATPTECREMIIFIRKIVSDLYEGEKVNIQILYGGSVNEENAGTFITEGTAQGLLVGRASLDVKIFTKLTARVASVS